MALDYAVNFRGHTACPCLAAWLPVYEKELLRRGVIKKNIDIYQLIGGASASAGTHAKGGAFDILQSSTEAVYVARQMGADATWRRTPAQGFSYHAHGVLRGCPHNYPARYQIDAVDDGYNGLGKGGRGGKDDGYRPLSHRSWKQGIEWAKKQQALGQIRPDNAVTRKPPAVPAKWSKVFHRSDPYRAGNSIQGLDEAKAKGYTAVDLDALISKDGVVENTHWPEVIGKGGFYDPLGKIARDARVASLTHEQVARLRSKDGYVIRRMSAMIEEAKKRNLRVEVEAKSAVRFRYGYGGLGTFRKLYEAAKNDGANVQVKVISTTPYAKLILAAAHKAGFTTFVLPRGARTVPKSWWPYIDYVRGPVIWTNK